MTFSKDKNSSLKNSGFDVQCIKSVCYVCFAAQIRFVLKVIKNGRCGIKKRVETKDSCPRKTKSNLELHNILHFPTATV